jgi:hypothetical protein
MLELIENKIMIVLVVVVVEMVLLSNEKVESFKFLSRFNFKSPLKNRIYQEIQLHFRSLIAKT